MALRVSFDAKDRVKSAIDIVDLTSSYLTLRREGRGYKALCPWHDDSRPSLQINPARQSFKCWVCDIGGDVFSFIMKMENVEFPEALRMLAERAGVALEEQRSPSGGPSATDEKQRLYRSLAWAESLYHEMLTTSPEAAVARKYLSERGISDDSIRRYHLGFAPDSWDWLVGKSQGTELALKTLETAGLIGRRTNGHGYYDRFKGRVLFSIRDLQGRPVAFGGRVLPEIPQPNTGKYINSPETPLFSKSNMLYGLDSAKDSISKSRSVLVMEGYTDCIVARQYGFGNSVAVLGTALGERHVKLLQRFADRVTLVLDGDEAGQRRTQEILGLFLAEQVDLRILTLPEGLDPCDYLQKYGAESFAALVDNAVDPLEHTLWTARSKVSDRNTLHGANQAVEHVLATMAKSPAVQQTGSAAQQLRENYVLNRLESEYRIDDQVLRERLAEIRRTARRPTTFNEDQTPTAEPAAVISCTLTPWERELLELLLLEPESLSRVCEVVTLQDLESEACRLIYCRARELFETGVLADFSRLLLEFDQPEIKNLLVVLDEQGRAKGADAVTRLRDLLERLEHQQHQKEIRQHTSVLQQRQLGAGEEIDVLQNLIRQQRKRQGISDPTDG